MSTFFSLQRTLGRSGAGWRVRRRPMSWQRVVYQHATEASTSGGSKPAPIVAQSPVDPDPSALTSNDGDGKKPENDGIAVTTAKDESKQEKGATKTVPGDSTAAKTKEISLDRKKARQEERERKRAEAKASAKAENAKRRERKARLRREWEEKKEIIRELKHLKLSGDEPPVPPVGQEELGKVVGGTDNPAKGAAGVKMEDEEVDDSKEGKLTTAKIKFPRSKEDKATMNAETVDVGRTEQQETGPQSRFSDPTITLGSGAGAFPYYLPFETTKMIYPPSDVYPPPLPRLRDADPDIAARALAVMRSNGVQWVEDKKRRASIASGGDVLEGSGQWRSVVRDAEWFALHQEMDRQDSEQSLEYIGDSLLHLLSRSALMMRFPRRTMNLYNVGANFLVSNDVFGHVYRDAGLEQERAIVARQVQARSKAAELKRVRSSITPREYEERLRAPLPEPIFTPVHHLRQADLFEAYVGAVYLTLGFNEASKWCTRLFQPWLDRLARTPGFDAPRFLTPDGELRARLQQSMRNQVVGELRTQWETDLNAVSAPKRFVVRLLRRLLGKNVYLSSDVDERTKT